MAALSLEAVTRVHRNGVVALRELSLEVRDSELLSVVGPSGCGKSTLLNLVAGLDAPTSGVIRIDGRPVNHLSPRERDVAMVFQSYALYPHLDVRRNLAFPLEVAGRPRAEVAARVAETARLLGLEPLLERRPRELSGGQRQRVALGRALIRRPRLFLLDEPLSNLDATLRVELRAELKKLHERLGATFVHVTHDQAEAMTLSDRIAVLREGTLQQVAPPRELYAAPANAFVAAFVGTPRVNLVRPETLGLSAPGVQVGIRPEAIELLPAAAPGSVEGRVWLVEPVGAETFVTVERGGELLTVRAPPEFQAGTGVVAHLRADSGRLLWFDAGSGRRVPAPGGSR